MRLSSAPANSMVVRVWLCSCPSFAPIPASCEVRPREPQRAQGWRHARYDPVALHRNRGQRSRDPAPLHSHPEVRALRRAADGFIVQLVAEARRAWLPASRPGREGPNQLALDRHEIANPGRSWLPDFPSAKSRRELRSAADLHPAPDSARSRCSPMSRMSRPTASRPREKFPWRRLPASGRRPLGEPGSYQQTGAHFSLPRETDPAVEEAQHCSSARMVYLGSRPSGYLLTVTRRATASPAIPAPSFSSGKICGVNKRRSTWQTLKAADRGAPTARLTSIQPELRRLRFTSCGAAPDLAVVSTPICWQSVGGRRSGQRRKAGLGGKVRASMDIRCRITFGGARAGKVPTENRPPRSPRAKEGKGETVGKSAPRLQQCRRHGNPTGRRPNRTAPPVACESGCQAGIDVRIWPSGRLLQAPGNRRRRGMAVTRGASPRPTNPAYRRLMHYGGRRRHPAGPHQFSQRSGAM